MTSRSLVRRCRPVVVMGAVIMCVLISGAPQSADLGGLYRDDGFLLDTIMEASRGPVLRKTAIGGQEVMVTGRPGAPQVSAETQARNAAMTNAGNKALELRDAMRAPTWDVEAIQALLKEFSMAQDQVRYYLNQIETQIQERRLPATVLDRHRRTVADIESSSADLIRLMQDALAGDEGAADAARALLDSSFNRAEPALRHASPKYSMEKKTAPRIERSDAGMPPPMPINIDPPTAADLAETEDIVFTPEIIAKAAELGNSPLAMYEYVRNNTEWQPYLGSRKGAADTLRQLRGNDTDQASLLMALLRSAGIPSRYVRGSIELDPATTANWQGVDDAAEAAAILTTAGLDGVAIVDGPDVVAVRSTHVWVEAYVPYSNYRGAGGDASGKTWVPLAPSFKQNDIRPGLDTLSALSFDEDVFLATYISTFTVPTPVETYQADVQAYLDANDPGKTVADVERLVEIDPQALALLPASLPFTVLSISDRLAELEDNKRYKVRLHLYLGGTTFINRIFNLTELAGQRFTIEYVGATQTDQDTIDSFNGLYETPPNLVNLKPLMKLNSVVVETGTNAIGMGRTHNFDMEFMEPLGATNVQPLVQNTHTAGNGLSVGFDTFLDVRDTFFDDPNLPPGEQLDAILYATAVDYLDRVDRAEEAMERLMGVVTTQDVSEAIVSNQISVSFAGGNPVTFEWTGLFVDADRRVVGAFAVNGDPSRNRPISVVAGMDSSYSENRVFEDIFGRDAVSTIKILELSSDAGITICTITASIFGDCPTFSHGASIQAAVNSAIAGGNKVIIPANPITISLWSGTGYIDQESNGAAGYIIAGGISSGNQSVSGGATVDSWPIFLPCEATDVSGVMLFPPADAPHPDAVFCPNNQTITFILELTTTCESGDVEVQNLNLTTHKTTKQFGPGIYDLVLQAFGTQILRTIKIGEVKIVSHMPAADLELGKDLTIGYEVDFPGGMDTANLEIRNKNDTMVYEMLGIDPTEGSHQTMWTGAKWNKAPNAGAYANPKNSNYMTKITGAWNGQPCESNPMPINTKLILETLVEDKLAGAPAAGKQAAGLEDMLDALKVVMKKGGSETVISGAGSITVTDESAGSKTDIKKRLKVDDPALNNLDDGTYDVLLKDLRDEIGNFTDENNNAADGIQPKKTGQVNIQ